MPQATFLVKGTNNLPQFTSGLKAPEELMFAKKQAWL
jgi:hypothetical protein